MMLDLWDRTQPFVWKCWCCKGKSSVVELQLCHPVLVLKPKDLRLLLPNVSSCKPFRIGYWCHVRHLSLMSLWALGWKHQLKAALCHVCGFGHPAQLGMCEMKVSACWLQLNSCWRWQPNAILSAVDLPQFTMPIATGIGQYPNGSTMLSYICKTNQAPCKQNYNRTG